MPTFFAGWDLGLATAEHTGETFSAHAIPAARESWRLLRPANAVMQIAEAPFAALAVLETLVLEQRKTILSLVCILLFTTKTHTRHTRVANALV